MFSLTSSMRYYLYSYPADMRRSLYTLSGIVTNQMRRNVQDGDVFIFINRPCTSMKILHMECGGLVIYHLKLESGSFKLPVFDENTNTFKTSWQDLMMMVQGGLYQILTSDRQFRCLFSQVDIVTTDASLR